MGGICLYHHCTYEYGGPKKEYTTFTTTGCASCFLSNNRSIIKVDSATLGAVVDMGITDAFNMGAVMAPAAAKVIYNHLKDTNRTIDYYDLILTGDLGVIGKMILKDYIKKEYNINLKNYDDSACMIFVKIKKGKLKKFTFFLIKKGY